MLNSKSYNDFLRSVVVKLGKVTDGDLKQRFTVAFKAILAKSIGRPAVFNATPDFSSHPLLLKALTDLNTLVSQLTESDYDAVKDLLVTKAELLASVVDVDTFLDGDDEEESAVAHETVATTGAVAVSVDVPVLPLEERAIFEAIQGQGDDGKPYFLPSQQATIIEYIGAALKSAKTDPLSPDRRTLAARLNTLKAQFTTVSSVGFSVDGERDPVIFIKINQACKNALIAFKKENIKRIIDGYSEVALQHLSGGQLDAVYTKAIVIERELAAVNHALNFFTVEKAKLRQALPRVQFIAQLAPGSDNLDLVKFMIVVPDISLGYSIHNLLLISRQIVAGQRLEEVYGEALRFELSKEEFLNLKDYLGELQTWYDDFNVILGCLLGESVDNYTKTGQKALSEIVKIEKARLTQNLPPFIASSTLVQLERMDKSLPVLLIGQVALDLTHHIDHDAMRALFESLYKNHNQRDAKNDLKTFIKGAPGYEYVSLLSIPNIMAIFNDLMAHAALASIAREMGYASGVSPEFFEMLGAANSMEAYASLLETKLSELPIANLDQVSQVGSKRTIRALAARANLRPAAGTRDLSVLDSNFCGQVQSMLNSLSSLALRPMSGQGGEPDLSDAQCRALLPTRTAERFPTTAADLSHLFTKLKECAAYERLVVLYEERRQEILRESRGGTVLPTLTDCLEQLEQEFKNRLIAAPQRGGRYYGAEPLTLASKLLITFFARVYYQDVTGITDNSMVAAFIKLAELGLTAAPTRGGERAQRDMDGCERGLAGRVAEPSGLLVSRFCDPFDAVDLQLRRTLAEKICNMILRVGSESSMAYLEQPWILYELGLSPVPGVGDRNEEKARAFFAEFVKHYTPAAIYEEYYKAKIQDFKVFVANDDNDKIYLLLQSLGFIQNREGAISADDRQQLDQQFRMKADDPASKWNFAKFQAELAPALIQMLILRGKISPNHAKQDNQELVTTTGRRVSGFRIPVTASAADVVMPLQEQQYHSQERQPPQAQGARGGLGAMFNTVFDGAPATAAAAPSRPSGATGSALAGGHFDASRQQQERQAAQRRAEEAERVRQVAASKLALNSTTTSNG